MKAMTTDLLAAQKQLWIGQKLLPESPLYNMAFLFTISGQIDPTHFQAAFKTLVQKCDALRMVFEETSREETDKTVQKRVLQQIDETVLLLDFSAKANPQTAAQNWAHTRTKHNFNLSKKLFDTALITAGDRTFWYLNQHHLITDMVSLQQLYKTLSDLYQSAIANTPIDTSSLPSYAEVTLPPPSTKAIAHWQQQPKLNEPLPLYHRTRSQQNGSQRNGSQQNGEQPSETSHRHTYILSAQKTAALKKLSLSSPAAALTPQLSLFNLLAGIVLAYLHRISDRTTVAFATPAQGRPSATFKQTIGVFIELFPLQVSFDEAETFSSLLTKVSAASSQLLRHAQPGASKYAFDRNVNVSLNFLSAKLPDFAGHPMQAQWLHPDASDPHHHLRILAHDLDNRGQLQLHFDFNAALFNPALQAQAPSHLLALINAALEDLSQPIDQTNLLTTEEKARLKELSHSTPLSVTETVIKQFEHQVAKTPDAIAIHTQNNTPATEFLTYQQLNNKANQLAHFLQTSLKTSLKTNQPTSEAPIALCLPRSAEMVVAILAILKADKSYVPIEPSSTPEQISYILEDTDAQQVLTDSNLSHQFTTTNAKVLSLNTLSLENQPQNNLPQTPSLTNLAYCLYTSGSTGKPKGVKITQRSLANYIQWAKQQYVGNRTLSFPLFTPLSFDLTVTSLYLPLISGGQIVVYREDTAEDNTEDNTAIDVSVQRVFQDNLVDIIKLTPSHLALVKDLPIGDRIKVLILGGENLKTSLAQSITQDTNIELYNEYGPTEATVGCMVHRFTDDNHSQSTSVPIGLPAAGADIYLLDQHLNQVPLGDVGEIFIGGPNLAAGYLNRTELTAEKFITRAGERLYRTGDLGRWEPNGTLSYLGRRDRQVKINGTRIELGEIESILLTHPNIKDCVITATKTAHKERETTQLVAYYTSQKNNPTVSELKDFARQELSYKLQPTHFIALGKIPLTANGKVDTKALPKVDLSSQQTHNSFIAPKTPFEQAAADIWQQVLGRSKISTQDNFFDLGGDSIMAVQIAAKLNQSGINISPGQLFKHPTIAELSAVLNLKDIVSPETAQNEPPSEEFTLPSINSSQLDKLSALLEKADLEEADLEKADQAGGLF